MSNEVVRISKEKRIKGIVTIPSRFWQVIDNKMDGELINSRGDAVISMILELQKLSPSSVKFNPPPEKIPEIKPEIIDKVNSILNIDIKTVKPISLDIIKGEFENLRKLKKT